MRKLVAPSVIRNALVARERPFGFGRIPSTDPRNADYPMRDVEVPRIRSSLLRRTETLPWQRTWYLLRAEQIDQGNTPMCVEAATRHVQLSRPMHLVDSRPFGTLYGAAKLIDGYPEAAGTDANAMLKVLRDNGVVASWWWYLNDDPELLDRWILTTGPVLFGAQWTDLMLQTDGLRVEVGDGPFSLGHEVALIGFNRRTKRTLAVNSWGRSNYGVDGRFELTYEDRTKLFDPAKGWADAVGIIDQRNVI